MKQGKADRERARKSNLKKKESQRDLQPAWSSTVYKLYQQLPVKPGVHVMSTSHA